MTTSNWDEARTAHWLTLADGRERQAAPITAALFEAAALQPGERVLDVGCGTGGTTVRAHELVAPDGRVTGTDVSAGMIGAAQRAAAGLDIDWLLGDAQTTDFGDGRFDVVLSRFGVMFFDDTAAAFANLSRACEPDGRLALAVWQRQAPLFALPLGVVARVLSAAGREVPEFGPGPGPMTLGDPDATAAMLHDSGWRDVDVFDPDVTLHLEGGIDPARAAEIAVDGGPAARLLADVPAELVAASRQALEAAYAERWDGQGVALPAGCWIVTARSAA